jgi:peptidoglycan/xylan/chitin deacetylase (PgdA/CDA1 family)
MAVAPLMAEVLNKYQVKVTFFAANERTQAGDGSLGAHWAPWWKARAAEGHEFASHTWDHVYWRADVPRPASRSSGCGPPRARPRART